MITRSQLCLGISILVSQIILSQFSSSTQSSILSRVTGMTFHLTKNISDKILIPSSKLPQISASAVRSKFPIV